VSVLAAALKRGAKMQHSFYALHRYNNNGGFMLRRVVDVPLSESVKRETQNED
jgi:hypothetical protein